MDNKTNAQTQLAKILAAIGETEGVNYAMRNKLVIGALACAQAIGLEAGIRLDPLEPDWPVVFIELPTGQVSWHIEPHTKVWDGHLAEEKNKRIQKFIQKVEFRKAVSGTGRKQ